jgi:hypothetical protein
MVTFPLFYEKILSEPSSPHASNYLIYYKSVSLFNANQ